MHRVAEVGSTQDEARRLYDQSVEARDARPLLLIADRQVRGRGRTGHEWIHAPRALACSVVLRPDWPTESWTLIPLVAGLAAQRAVRAEFGVHAGLKWPNDIVTEDGKVGGLLSEASGSVVVVGCGINLWWPDPPPGMAALVAGDPGSDASAQLATAFADDLVRRLADDPGNWGHEQYRATCATLGTWIEWDPSGYGEAVDVASDGSLVVETESGRVSLRSGTVRSVRPATLPPDQAGG